MSADDSDSIVQKHKPPILLKMIDFKNEKRNKQNFTSIQERSSLWKIETTCIITTNGDTYKCFGTNNRVFPDSDLGESFLAL